MRSSSPVRHLLHLRAVVAGISPPIARELHVDRDASVEDLRRALQAAFGLTGCERYEFTDSRDPALPAGADLAELTEADLYEHQRRVSKQWPPRQPDQRWGDRWTMIDHRDPSVHLDAVACVSELFRSRPAPIPWYEHRSEAPRSRVVCYFQCDHVEPHTTWQAGHPWWLTLEVVGDDIAFASEPAATLVGGSGARPHDERLGAHRHAVLLAQWRDADAPEHATARAQAAAAVGPWATFDPDAFSLDAERVEFERAMTGDAGGIPSPRAAELLGSVRRTARPGLRRHLEAVGVGIPSVVTAEEAAQAVEPFRRLILDAVTGAGRPFEEVDAEVARFDERTDRPDAAAALLEDARRLRLIYRRAGSWRVRRDALGAAAAGAVALWRLLARAVGEGGSCERLHVLLAIADGTIADQEQALDRIRQALAGDEGCWHDPWPYRPRGRGLNAELGDIRRLLAHLVPGADAATVDLATPVVREFARACVG
ncbi:MAG: hypothetical protein QM602_09840 [Microbacterium sp.]